LTQAELVNIINNEGVPICHYSIYVLYLSTSNY